MKNYSRTGMERRDYAPSQSDQSGMEGVKWTARISADKAVSEKAFQSVGVSPRAFYQSLSVHIPCRSHEDSWIVAHRFWVFKSPSAPTQARTSEVQPLYDISHNKLFSALSFSNQSRFQYRLRVLGDLLNVQKRYTAIPLCGTSTDL